MQKIVWALLFVTACHFANGQGSFHYVSHHQGTLQGANRSYFDFNEDGTDDLSVLHVCYTAGSSVFCHLAARYESDVRLLTPSANFGSPLILMLGDRISSDFSVRETVFQHAEELGEYSWVGHLPLSSPPVLAYAGGGSRKGIWAHDESIIGIQFLGEGGYHNGWVRFELDPNYSQGNLYRVADWAYNLTPGEPILAGMLQVPEPQSWLLLMSGFGIVFWCTYSSRR